MTYLSPILFSISGDAKNKEMNQKTRKASLKLVHFSLIIVLIFAVVGYGARNLIIGWFLPDKYTLYANSFPFFIFSGGLFSISQFMEMKLKSDMNSQALLWPKIINSLFCVAIVLLGAYFFDFYGVVMGLLLFAIVNFAWFYLLSFKKREEV
jgi:O-antigen/teichoic acid export membrane protein